MLRRIWLITLAAIILFSGVNTDVPAGQKNTENSAVQTQDKGGLYPLKKLELPRDIDSVGENLFLEKEIDKETLEDAKEWEQYGSKFFYNQLEKNEKKLWDALDALGYSYLAGKKDANYYWTWYGSDHVAYEGIPEDRVEDVVFFFLLSNPQYYFFIPGYAVERTSERTGTVTLQIDGRVSNGNKRALATKKIKETVDVYVGQINQEKTAVAKEKKAHDLICGKVVYDYDLSDENVVRNQTVYSVFLTDKTVCAGYSQAMQLLCGAVGIDCISVTSKAHEWNMVRIDDIWYCTDLTWNDGEGSEIYYLYFNRSEEMLLALEGENDGRIGENHIPEDIWNGYLPTAIKDSGADYHSIGTIYPPKEQTASPEIFIDDYGTVYMNQESGADIYYTTNGDIPSLAKTKSKRYTAEFDVPNGTDVKAVAVRDGYWDSNVVSFDWPAETVLSYANQALIFYVGKEETFSWQVEGMDELGVGMHKAKFDGASGKFKWIPPEACIGKCFDLTFSGQTDDGQKISQKVQIQVRDAMEEEFAIAGQAEIILSEGYEAMSTGSFAVTGTRKIPSITLSGNTGAGKITWDEEDRQIKVLPGLTEGLYRVMLTAAGESEETAELEISLWILNPDDVNHLPELESPLDSVCAYVGKPVVFYVKVKDEDIGDEAAFLTPDLTMLEGDADFDKDTGRFYWKPAKSEEGSTKTVVFTACDHTEKPVRYSVAIEVKSAWQGEKPLIYGEKKMTLMEGYEETQTDSFCIIGAEPDSEVNVALADKKSPYIEWFGWNRQTRQLEIKPGLPAGSYEILLEMAENHAFCWFELYIAEDIKADLKASYQDMCTLGQGTYTSASWAKYQAILSKVKNVLENQRTQVNQMAEALDLLIKGRGQLETIEEAWSRLSALYLRQDFEQKNYTPASWAAYQTALEKIYKLPEGFLEEELDGRLKELKAAYEKLIYAAEKNRLKSLLESAALLIPSDYVSESYAYMMGIKGEAMNVYRNENAAQAEVDAIYLQLQAAMEQLVKVPQKGQENHSLPGFGVIRKKEKYVDLKSELEYEVTNVSKQTVKVVRGTNKKSVSIRIPDSVTINGVKCNVTEVGADAFKGFLRLKKAVVGSKAAKIGKRCFYGCKKLETVVIGGNVKEIGKRCFYNCVKLKKITVKGTKIVSVKSDAFGKCGKKMLLILPQKISEKQKRVIQKKFKKAGVKEYTPQS